MPMRDCVEVDISVSAVTANAEEFIRCLGSKASQVEFEVLKTSILRKTASVEVKSKSRTSEHSAVSPIFALNTPLTTFKVCVQGVAAFAGQSCESPEDALKRENLKSKFVPVPPCRAPPVSARRP